MNLDTNNSTSATGRRYWRSLDELADTPEFKDWLHREFPVGASELVEDGSTRRQFLKLMSASFALAGVATLGAGCRKPEEHLEPFGKQPEGYIYGEPQYFATAMPTRTGAIPLVVKSYEGRPIKIEGNALFPGGNGGTDRYAQASILDLYDPDRARHFKHDGKIVSRDEALKFLDELSQKFSANQGEGLAFLAESSTSPSRARLRKIIAQKFPKSKWFTYDAIDSGIHQRAATQAFGQSVKPVFHFDKAKVILSLDCDFLGGEDGAHEHIRKFAAGRSGAGFQPAKSEHEGIGQAGSLPHYATGMSRLYAVESLFTLTGANADHRLRIAASLVGQIAGYIASQLGVGGASGKVDGDFASKWVSECASDLKAAGKNALVVAGQRQPIEVHLLAYAINSALGATAFDETAHSQDLAFARNTVTFHTGNEPAGDLIENFKAALKSKQIKSLVILGGNPAYHLDFLTAQKPDSFVRLGYYEDETSALSDWNFPAAHYLESWGDAKTSDGTPVSIQPLIQPLFGGLTELEFLARIAGEATANSLDKIRERFRLETLEGASQNSDENWKKFLFNGFQIGFNAAIPGFKFNGTILPVQSAAPSAQNLEVIFYRDAKVDDGRYANNGWMQELPDPITKMTWDNAVLVSRKTAKELGVANGDIVEISLNGKSVQGPIWVQPGMADYSLGLALGYGREKAGRVGTGVGFNAYKIFSGKYIETGATVKKTGETHVIAYNPNALEHGRPSGGARIQFVGSGRGGREKGKHRRGKISRRRTAHRQIALPNPLDEAKKTALASVGHDG